ncbi:MAG: nitroreductase family protein [Planctomycetota bacterium]|nr:nitroreductase family protein [Planctomycetota bacterium]
MSDQSSHADKPAEPPPCAPAPGSRISLPAQCKPSAAARVPIPRFDPGVPSEQAAHTLYESLRLRRSCRQFSDRPVPAETIEWCIRCAGTAPSGANKQPWRFIAINDPALKRQIRLGAEAEEKEFYERRASREWLADLAPLGTEWEKPFLETAPWLIAIFRLVKTDADEQGRSGQVYYPQESVGIASGMLVAALHLAGLSTLTHTPSPMNFLARILKRPEHERPFLLLPVGYAAQGATVPDIHRLPLEQIMVRNLGAPRDEGC